MAKNNTYYKKIKRQNGEAMAKLLRERLPMALEDNRAVKTLRYAGEGDDDFLKEALPTLIDIIVPEDEGVSSNRDIGDLLDEAGYDYEVTTTVAGLNKYKKYFRDGELLCTYNSPKNRLDKFHCLWLVKKGVESIKPAQKPKRQDAYGTSVMCIQVAKSGAYVSIKNRYNSTVTNPDNTFGSNPNNIIDGLSQAIARHLGCELRPPKRGMSKFVLVDKYIVRQNLEIDGIVFGNGCWVKDGKLHQIDPSHETIMDQFIYCTKKKCVWSPVTSYHDAFIDAANEAIKQGNFTITKQ